MPGIYTLHFPVRSKGAWYLHFTLSVTHRFAAPAGHPSVRKCKVIIADTLTTLTLPLRSNPAADTLGPMLYLRLR